MEGAAIHVPKQFAPPSGAAMRALIDAHPLAVFMTAGGALDASHVPFVWGGCLKGRLLLRGHLARANPQATALEESGGEALAVFTGPHAYVSPSYYASKKLAGKVVPTWNYATVHVHGIARIVEEAAWLDAMLDGLTQRMEAGRPEPWQTADAPPEFHEAMRRGIVGVELEVTRLEGKWKMSQDKSEADRSSTAAGLRADGQAAVADLIDTLSQDRGRPAAQ